MTHTIGRLIQACLDCGGVRHINGRGLCMPCYGRHRRAGTLSTFAASPRGVIRVRDWLATVAGVEGCWPWPGTKSQTTGYGTIQAAGHVLLVHRVAYQLLVGPIPAGLTLDHLCHNAAPVCSNDAACPHRACANPAHLEAVPSGVNTLRGHLISAVNARKTHCNVGHPLGGANLYTVPSNGFRQCRECKRAADRRRYWRMRAR